MTLSNLFEANEPRREMDPARLLYWIIERHAIYRRRAAGEPPPWTDDPILRAWPFTNTQRERDRTTLRIAKNWREPHSDDPNLWFAMVVARFVNHWPTLAEIGREEGAGGDGLQPRLYDPRRQPRPR